MQTNRINKIQKTAWSIDCRLNLFEGYTPKKTNTFHGELLFWRQVVNIYGLLADCDRTQIKRVDNNLITLMFKYSLISQEDMKFARHFWKDISDIRKWFCHNNNLKLYYNRIRAESLEKYLNRAFMLSSDKPKNLDEIVNTESWDLLTGDIERRFSDYLNIIENGLNAWMGSEYKDDLIDEWNVLFSEALFSDKELLQNVLADMAAFNMINQNIRSMTVPDLAKGYSKQLETKGFDARNIKSILEGMTSKKTNREIIRLSIKNVGLN